ncbi:hypothetical protein SESBI_21706 [Sesbania bispinosa]|nr:hypothetical protein SESBI_21706 [Sesbania bispinosa]
MESQPSVIVEAEVADVEDWNQREAVGDAAGVWRWRRCRCWWEVGSDRSCTIMLDAE